MDEAIGPSLKSFAVSPTSEFYIFVILREDLGAPPNAPREI